MQTTGHGASLRYVTDQGRCRLCRESHAAPSMTRRRMCSMAAVFAICILAGFPDLSLGLVQQRADARKTNGLPDGWKTVKAIPDPSEKNDTNAGKLTLWVEQ